MLTACRTQGDPYTVPPFDLTPDDVDGFWDEMKAFHEAFRSCFVRSEPRQHFFHDMAGQFSSLERKSIEPMALHMEGGNIRGMQRLISNDVCHLPHYLIILLTLYLLHLYCLAALWRPIARGSNFAENER